MTPQEQAFVDAIASQRDQALNAHANAQAALTLALQKIEQLEAQQGPFGDGQEKTPPTS